jgi:hypothetical protein
MEHIFGSRIKDAKKHHVENPSPKLISPVKEKSSSQSSIKFPKIERIKQYENYSANNNIFSSMEDSYGYQPPPSKALMSNITDSFRNSKPSKVYYK